MATQGVAPFADMADSMHRCRVVAHALLQSTGLDAPSMLIHALVSMQPTSKAPTPANSTAQPLPSSPADANTAPTPRGPPTPRGVPVGGSRPPSLPVVVGPGHLTAIAAWLCDAVVDDSNRWGVDVSPSACAVCCDQRDVEPWASRRALCCFVQAFGVYGAAAVAQQVAQVPCVCVRIAAAAVCVLLLCAFCLQSCSFHHNNVILLHNHFHSLQVLEECVASLTSVLASQGAVLAPLAVALPTPPAKATHPDIAESCIAQLPDGGRGVLRTLRRLARALVLRRMLADVVDDVGRSVLPEVSWVRV